MYIHIIRIDDSILDAVLTQIIYYFLFKLFNCCKYIYIFMQNLNLENLTEICIIGKKTKKYVEYNKYYDILKYSKFLFIFCFFSYLNFV